MGEYRPELVGGHLALDLVNTVAWRLDVRRRVDRIADPVNLRKWLAATGFDPVAGAREIQGDALRHCRETAYAVLHPLALGDEPEAGDLAVLRELIEDAVRNASLVSAQPLTWRAGTVQEQLRLAVWRLFEDEDLSRLRQCDDGDCGWLFLDRSRNGSRRWCSSADCGNRARARRHYQRRQAEVSA
ncbi:CGNR zinc finger domain-containing protein [Kribbella sp. NPDC050470]|uniref:CGNR zinc finger domain-containing protein n=1 Tax=unclassified Kribbella TaxID=2644121 RepID=UPI003790D2C8